MHPTAEVQPISPRTFVSTRTSPLNIHSAPLSRVLVGEPGKMDSAMIVPLRPANRFLIVPWRRERAFLSYFARSRTVFNLANDFHYLISISSISLLPVLIPRASCYYRLSLSTKKKIHITVVSASLSVHLFGPPTCVEISRSIKIDYIV
jgi:hypothetical protein